MLYKASVPLLINGDYLKKGDEIELSAEQAQRFDPTDLSPVGPEPAPVEEEVVEAVPVEDMTHAQLKERPKELGLSASGSRADLIERITLHSTAPVEEEEVEATKEEI